MAHSSQYIITCDRCGASEQAPRRSQVAETWRAEGGTYTAGRGTATCGTCRKGRRLGILYSERSQDDYIACVDNRGREVGIPVPMIDQLPVKSLVELDRWPGTYPTVRLADGRLLTVVDPATQLVSA